MTTRHLRGMEITMAWRGRTVAVAVALAGLALVLAGPAFAEEPPQEEVAQASPISEAPQVDSFNGVFPVSVPIRVPGFHGLEPPLAVRHQTGFANGMLGVGASLGGISVIQRASPGKGAPRYDSSDIYLLDGEELVLSGTLGGTYATKIQSYWRITYAAGANEWYVYERDGTKRTYVAKVKNGSQVFRWLLATVVDTRGNTVSYNWWCDGTAPVLDCYPDTVTYNGATVTFYRETRTDLLTYAAGTWLGQTRYRLKTIDVKVGTGRVRAYKLTYVSSSGTSRSLLSTVREYGRNATISGGTVTGGTALPATTLTYAPSSPTPLHGAPVYDSRSGGPASSYWTSYTEEQGDYNGDGRTDFRRYLVTSQNRIYSYVWLSQGDGKFADPVYYYHQGTTPEPAFPYTYYNVETGDYNADGKTDFRLYRVRSDGTYSYVYSYVWLSLGTGSFAAPIFYQYQGTTLEPAFPLPAYQGETGDYNGDGRSDFRLYRVRSNGTYSYVYSYVWLSLGTGSFAAPVFYQYQGTTPEPAFPLSEYDGVETGDYNGDGKTDFRIHRRTVDNKLYSYVWLSLGTGSFAAPVYYYLQGSTASPGFSYASYGIQPGDYNGDGKTDFRLHRRTADDKIYSYVWLSEGDGTFAAPVYYYYQGATATPGYSYTYYAMDTGDYNGDGKTDFLLRRRSLNNIYSYVWLSNGDGTFAARAYQYYQGTPATSSYAAYTLYPGDYDGDGKTDFRLIYATSLNLYSYVFPTTVGFESLLSSVQNGYGGTNTVTYQPSSAWVNTNRVPPVQTVTSVTTSDGRGNSTVTTLEYAGGLYDYQDRRFLGFRYVKQTKPLVTGESSSPYTETWFKQDYGSVSKPERVELRTGAGKLQTKAEYEYWDNGGTVPYQSLLKKAWKYQYEPTGTSYVRTCADRMCGSAPCYDAYGNVTQEVDHGFYDSSGDELTTTYSYPQNTSSYIVSGVGQQATYSGVGTGGTLLSRTRTYYDGAASHTSAPTKGLPTTSLRYLDATGGYVWQTSGYDSYGNVTSHMDEAGATTTTAYETSTAFPHVYPVTVTNHLGHTTTMQWDDVCGVQTTVIDVNGITSGKTYDDLCRLQQATLPLGGFARHFHCGLSWGGVTMPACGSATVQYRRVESPSADGNGNQWANTYFDGLGRTYKTAAKGPSTIYGEIAYTARGKVYTTTHPYYSGGTKYTTTTLYDALDRQTRVTNPDTTFTSWSYGTNSVTVVDPSGRQQGEVHDARGRVTIRKELLNGTWYETRSTYNGRGDRVRLTDRVAPSVPVGSEPTAETYGYDSLSRRTAMSSPDRGSWTYAYDGAGRMTSTRDALFQKTSLRYDILGRLTSRTLRDGEPDEVTHTFAYDEVSGVHAGYQNVGKQTTITDPAGKRRFDYDAAGEVARETQVINGVASAFEFTRDAGRRLVAVRYPDLDEVGPLAYDAAGRLKQIPAIVNLALYDATGNLTRQENSNGTVTTQTFSPQRLWLTRVQTVKGATTIQDLGYGWASGNGSRLNDGTITGVSSPFGGEAWTFAYDDLRRLTTASGSPGTQSITYDVNDNVLGNSAAGGIYAYPAPTAARPHGVLSVGGRSYAYDANGNMISRNGTPITYDGNNLPVAMGAVTYVNGADGKRLAQTAGGVTTYYLREGVEVTDCVLTKYFSLSGRQVAKRVGAATSWLHTDQQGTIQVITDGTGAVVGRQAFAPFGDLVGAPISGEAHGFAGEQRDATGLIYLRARYYDPLTGRFIAADPTTSDGTNRYMYALNSPVNFVDPTGFGGQEKSGGDLFIDLGKPGAPVHVGGFTYEPTGFRWALNIERDSGPGALQHKLGPVAQISLGAFGFNGFQNLRGKSPEMHFVGPLDRYMPANFSALTGRHVAYQGPGGIQFGAIGCYSSAPFFDEGVHSPPFTYVVPGTENWSRFAAFASVTGQTYNTVGPTAGLHYKVADLKHHDLALIASLGGSYGFDTRDPDGVTASWAAGVGLSLVKPFGDWGAVELGAQYFLQGGDFVDRADLGKGEGRAALGIQLPWPGERHLPR